MPGAANTPRPAVFEPNRAWFTAVGIPITPFDDRGVKNYYPMMRFTARDANGVVLATADVVLPVSDEMDCRACHASGGSPAARPAIGWAFDANAARDVARLKADSLRAMPSVERAAKPNDNVLSTRLQGHPGMLAECDGCHTSVPSTVSGGPHGLHPLGASWISRHGDIAENGSDACRACHGSDYRGSFLSRALGSRQLSTELGAKNFWRGFQIGCYTCHDPASIALHGDEVGERQWRRHEHAGRDRLRRQVQRDVQPRDLGDADRDSGEHVGVQRVERCLFRHRAVRRFDDAAAERDRDLLAGSPRAAEDVVVRRVRSPYPSRRTPRGTSRRSGPCARRTRDR